MKMKNLLSENMLRFGTKNLSETHQKELTLKSIMKTIKEHGLTESVKRLLTEGNGLFSLYDDGAQLKKGDYTNKDTIGSTVRWQIHRSGKVFARVKVEYTYQATNTAFQLSGMQAQHDKNNMVSNISSGDEIKVYSQSSAGSKGYNFMYFYPQFKIVDKKKADAVKGTMYSPPGKEGIVGNLTMRITHLSGDDGATTETIPVYIRPGSDKPTFLPLGGGGSF